jgi:prephenate dehydrogenase
VSREKKTVGIYGLGRFGSFYARLLAGHFNLRAYSRNPGREAPPGVERVDEDKLLSAPVVILCVAISALEEVLKRIAGRLRPGTLVMDTCSVKALPAAWMAEILPPGVSILATHPMFGPDSARSGVEGLPLILSPVRVDGETVAEWSGFFTSLGLKVLKMKPEEHDREAAFTQGLTHYLGRVLADLSLRDSPIASRGYAKLLDIIGQTCNDSRQLFVDLQRYNPYTRQMRTALGEALRDINFLLDEGAEKPSP